MIANRARFRYNKKLQKVVGFRIPDKAFHPATLSAITESMNIDALDPGTRDQILCFFKDFLNCRCRNTPLCGCPERKFAITILELREMGLTHKEIHQHILEKYGIDLFPADILSFLEESVHILEVVQAVSNICERNNLTKLTDEHIKQITR